MSSAKVSGYGIKVSAPDSRMDVTAFLENFGKVKPSFSEHAHSVFAENRDNVEFRFLAFSFKSLIEQEFPLLEFVFLAGPAFGSFAVVTRNSSREVTDGENPVGENDYNDFYDSHMLRLWVKNFLPGYEYDADWIFEDIDPDFVGLWKAAK